MTIAHHPSDELLLDYASGALSESWGLAIATHLALCPACRRAVTRMETVGGDLLEALAPAACSDAAFDAVLARLTDAADAAPIAVPRETLHETAGPAPVLPEPLRGYIGADLDHVPWQRLGLGAYQYVVPTTDGTTARLLRIPAGRPVPEHTHRGQELTLVLCGAFSDATGHYGAGDFQEADEQVQHQPHAAPGEDCICLAITDAPLRFRSLAARLVQPLLGI
jgi:putative transcriptional regulator